MKIPAWVKKPASLPGASEPEELPEEAVEPEPTEASKEEPDEATQHESDAEPIVEDSAEADIKQDVEEENVEEQAEPEDEPELEDQAEDEVQQEDQAPVDEDIEDEVQEGQEDEADLVEEGLEQAQDEIAEISEVFEAPFGSQAEFSQSEPLQAVEASAFAAEKIQAQYEPMHQDQPQAVDSASLPISAGAMFKIGKGRICLSINFVTAGVVVLIIFTLLLGAFVLGKKTASPSGEAAPAGSVGESSTVQPKPLLPSSESVISKLPDGPVEAPPLKRDPKRYYLIIETLKGKTDEDYDNADKIINFCAARGLPSELVENPKGRYAVWCLLGFRLRASDEALQHARNVELIGKEFFAKHKTYRFMQRNRKGGKFRPFFKYGKYGK